MAAPGGLALGLVALDPLDSLRALDPLSAGLANAM